MSLPEICEEYFSALYESQPGILDDKAQAKARSDAILKRIITQYGFKKEVVLKDLGNRYRTWVRENKLPQPPRE